jgi:hypothetical protein
MDSEEMKNFPLYAWWYKNVVGCDLIYLGHNVS